VQINDVLDVTLIVAAALDKLGISYLVGGSLASSLHGIPRSTHDADIVVDLKIEQVDALVSELEGAFHIDGDSARDAIRRRRMFNILHLETLFKVDLFIPDEGEYSAQQMARRQTLTVKREPTRELSLASAEDVVLHKLHWFKLGGGASDRQWQDALAVIRVQSEKLDRSYLDQWASDLGVADLLARALEEADASGRDR